MGMNSPLSQGVLRGMLNDVKTVVEGYPDPDVKAVLERVRERLAPWVEADATSVVADDLRLVVEALTTAHIVMSIQRVAREQTLTEPLPSTQPGRVEWIGGDDPRYPLRDVLAPLETEETLSPGHPDKRVDPQRLYLYGRDLGFEAYRPALREPTDTQRPRGSSDPRRDNPGLAQDTRGR